LPERARNSSETDLEGVEATLLSHPGQLCGSKMQSVLGIAGRARNSSQTALEGVEATHFSQLGQL
jgi:hypothetical protein